MSLKEQLAMCLCVTGVAVLVGTCSSMWGQVLAEENGELRFGQIMVHFVPLFHSTLLN